MARTLADHLEIWPLADSFAAEVIGLDLTLPAPANTIEQIVSALSDHGVLSSAISSL